MPGKVPCITTSLLSEWAGCSLVGRVQDSWVISKRLLEPIVCMFLGGWEVMDVSCQVRFHVFLLPVCLVSGQASP